jgi:hypothetical protein
MYAYALGAETDVSQEVVYLAKMTCSDKKKHADKASGSECVFTCMYISDQIPKERLQMFVI